VASLFPLQLKRVIHIKGQYQPELCCSINQSSADEFPPAVKSHRRRQYQRNAIEEYEKIASNQMRGSGVDAWFRQYRSALNDDGRIAGPARAAVPAMLHELETDARSVEDLGALNRWAERSAVPIERYLRLWQKSCNVIGAAGRLPKRLADLLGL
jgi:hypothetical protein